MIGQQQYAAQAQLVQDLCADAVVAVRAVTSLNACLLKAKPALLHQRISLQLVNQIKIVLALPQVEHDASPCGCYLFKRSLKLKARRAYERAEHSKRDVFSMYANEHRLLCGHVAHDHCQMNFAVDNVLESDGAKTSIDGRQLCLGCAADQSFFAYAIANQVCDRDDFQVMLSPKIFQFRQPRHSPVRVHNLADHSSRIKPSDARHVNARFCLSGTDQHAASSRSQRKNVTGSSKVLRASLRINCGKDSYSSILRGDAGRNPTARFD